MTYDFKIKSFTIVDGSNVLETFEIEGWLESADRIDNDVVKNSYGRFCVIPGDCFRLQVSNNGVVYHSNSPKAVDRARTSHEVNPIYIYFFPRRKNKFRIPNFTIKSQFLGIAWAYRLDLVYRVRAKRITSNVPRRGTPLLCIGFRVVCFTRAPAPAFW